MTMGAQISGPHPVFNSFGYPEVGLLYHILVLFLLFKGTIVLFYVVTVPLHMFTNSAQELQFLHILINIYYFLIF